MSCVVSYVSCVLCRSIWWQGHVVASFSSSPSSFPSSSSSFDLLYFFSSLVFWSLSLLLFLFFFFWPSPLLLCLDQFSHSLSDIMFTVVKNLMAGVSQNRAQGTLSCPSIFCGNSDRGLMGFLRPHRHSWELPRYDGVGFDPIVIVLHGGWGGGEGLWG